MEMDWVTFLALSEAAAKIEKRRKADLFHLVLMAARGNEEGVSRLSDDLSKD